MIKCSKCGFEDDGKFCSNCGSPLAIPEKMQVLVFKHTIAVLEPVDMPKQEFTIRE